MVSFLSASLAMFFSNRVFAPVDASALSLLIVPSYTTVPAVILKT